MQLARTASILVSPPKSCILHSANFKRDWRSDAVEKSVVSVANSENYDKRRSLICNASSASSTGGAAEVQRPIAEEPRSVAIQVRAGKPMPFGATVCDGGVNFAIFSGGASSATLCLFSLVDLKASKVTEEVLLDPMINKTGNVWHVFVEGEIEDMLYGYKFDGKFCPEEGHYFDSSRVLLDPYAKAVISRGEYGVLGPDGNCWPQMAGMIPSSSNEFDWEGDLPLHYPLKDLIIYEMHVRGYTKHDSSKTDFPGTYLGAVDKLDHLKELGVNCIELMPSQEFNELEYFDYSSVPGESKLNFWGYSTVNYFSPMMRYSFAGMTNSGRNAINEFKILVREAHKRGIEVLLDVVFNHTAEGNENGPILSFRGIDNSIYYMLAPKWVQRWRPLGQSRMDLQSTSERALGHCSW